MKFYEFGNKNNPVVFLIHGTGSHWKLSFGNVIAGLTDEYCVVCVSLDGHDETEIVEMTSITNQVDKLEKHILNHFNGKIYGVYGSSLGGSIVGKILESGKISIAVAITGSTDFEQFPKPIAFLKSKFTIPILYKYIKTGELGIYRHLFRSNALETLKKLKEGMYKDISYDTLFREYYTDLYTKVSNDIAPGQTQINCVYGRKESEKKLRKRYSRHFPNANLIGLDGLGHEELLAEYPNEWVVMIKNLLKKGNDTRREENEVINVQSY